MGIDTLRRDSVVTSKPEKILIVGGGIAGLAAAIGLQRRGFDVDIVEKNSKWSVYHVGIVVQHNFVRALQALGLAEEAVAAGFPYNGSQFRDLDGSFLEDLPAGEIDGLPANLGLTRPALHKVLQDKVKALGVPVRVGVTFDRLDDDGDKVHVDFTDGSSGDYDFVIGADGNYSAVRKAVFPEAADPAYTGQGVWRYNLPRPADMHHGEIYVGKEKGKVGAIPLSTDTMYIWAVFEEEGNPFFPRGTLAAEMRKRLEGYGGRMAAWREMITDNDLVVYRPLEAVIMPDPWYKGRVMLIGDAAHSATPHLGQGAAMAVEDAVVLSEELGNCDTLEQALENTMRRRFDRAKYIGMSSIQIGNWEMEGNRDNDAMRLHHEVRRKLSDPI